MTVQRPAGAGDLRVYFGPKGDGRTYLRPVLGAASVIAESCAGYVREFSPTALPAPEPPGALQAGGSQPWPLKKRKARSHGRFKKRKEAPGAGYIELAVPKANGACQGQSDADRDRGQSLDDPLRLRTPRAYVRHQARWPLLLGTRA